LDQLRDSVNKKETNQILDSILRIKIVFFYALIRARIGNISLAIVLLISTETLKYNWVLNSLEPMICAAQVPVQISLFVYFFSVSLRISDGKHTWQDIRVLSFLGYLILNALFFANNCLLSYLEFIANDRFDQ
jgi:hypothetical protein